MWMLANTALGPALPTLASVAPASYQALSIRLPQLNRTLSRVLEAMKSYQTGPARRHLNDCQRLATSVLNPAEQDQEKQDLKVALDRWYAEDFSSFVDDFEATVNTGVTAQERLAAKLERVIIAFRTQVFSKPYSDPPAHHPSVVSHDQTRRPTVPEVKIRPAQDETAARLIGDTFRTQAKSIRMEWREKAPEKAIPAERRVQNAAFYGMVEEALARHSGENLIIFLDRDWKQMRGMAMLLWIELTRRKVEAAKWLSNRHIEVVSRPDQVSCLITYSHEKKKLEVSQARPFNPQTGRA